MLKKLEDAYFEGKRVLVRVDYNVPLKDGKVADDERLKASLPTIEFLLKKKCSIILMSHLGRPNGKVADEMKLDSIADRLSELLNMKVKKLDDCIGSEVSSAVEKMEKGEVVLLENLRFHNEEEENNEDFAKALASLADVYVNDAFGASHRAHASVVGITNFIPGYAGFLLEKEVKTLGNLLKSPKKPFIAVLGGAKASDKIRLIENLQKKADKILMGGAMAFTFLKAGGYETGNSKVENDSVGEAGRLMKKGKIVLPVDVVIADRFEENASSKAVCADNIEKGWAGLYIGPETVKIFKKGLEEAKTIVWNGPMGVFEFDKFAKGTDEIARFIANSKAATVIGGGDTQ